MTLENNRIKKALAIICTAILLAGVFAAPGAYAAERDPDIDDILPAASPDYEIYDGSGQRVWLGDPPLSPQITQNQGGDRLEDPPLSPLQSGEQPGGVARASASAAAQIVQIDHSRDVGSIVDAVRQYPHSAFVSNKETRYASAPIISPPTYTDGAVGAMHADDIADAQNTLKMIRFIAGLPYANIEFNNMLNRFSQYGAYYLAVTNQMAHKPIQINGVPDAFFNMAYQGCANANIAAGYSNTSESLLAYMTEPGANNIENAGHRRWMLRPGGANFGIGYVRGPSGDRFGGYRSSLYVTDGLPGNDFEPDTYIAWPSSGDFPIQYMVGLSSVSNYGSAHYAYPWSVNLGAAYLTPVKDDLTLTLTRYRGGAVNNTWVFDSSTPTLTENTTGASQYGMHFAVDNDGYGMGKAIVFRPDTASLGMIRDGDIFNVRIQGLKNSDTGGAGELSYDIRFFDLQREMSRSTVTFYVRHNGAPLAGATVTAGGASAVTGANGVAKLRFANNSAYNYSISKDGYVTESATFNLGGVSLSAYVDMYLAVSFAFTDTVRTYIGAAQGLTVSATPNIAFALTYDGSAALPIGAGTYTAVAAAMDVRYKGSAEARFTIERAPLTAEPQNLAITYGDALPAPVVAYTGLVGRDTGAGAANIRAVYDPGVPNAPDGRYNAGVYYDKVNVTTPDYNVTVHGNALTIDTKTVTATGFTVFDREYAPGGVDAIINTSGAAIIGAFDGDDVYLDISGAVAVFEDDALGADKNVHITGLSLGGGQAGNYMLSNASVTLKAGIKDKLTAADVAASFGNTHIAHKDSRIIKFPEMPAGFEVFITESLSPDVVAVDGTIYPVPVRTEVAALIAVRRLEPTDTGVNHPDNYAPWGPIIIVVPAFTRYTINASVTVQNAPAGAATARADGAGTYYIGDEVALRAVSLSNNVTFDGWYENGVLVNGAGAQYRFSASADRSLEARFTWRPVQTPPPAYPPGGGGGGPAGNVNTDPPLFATPTPRPTATPTPKATVKPVKTPRKAVIQPRTERRKNAGRGDAASGIPQMADIGDSHWAAAEIRHLTGIGVINGYPVEDGTFIYAPERHITRAEFMKLIAACLGLPLIEQYDGSRYADWGDVEEWAKPYIATLVEADIVYGSLEWDGLYINPLNDITREEMTVMAMRALSVMPEKADPQKLQFVGDLDTVYDWALDGVAFALANGLVNTRGAGGDPVSPVPPGGDAIMENLSFAPREPARRDEAAVLLSRVLKFIAV